jgi:hypothetical protein
MRLTALSFVTICLGGSAMAATVTLNAIDWGNYSSTGAHNAASWSYVAGNCASTVCPASGVYRDFFVFNLNPLAAIQGIDITDATLTLINPSSNLKDPLHPFNGGYQSPNMSVSGNAGQPADTFSIFDVTSSIAAVRRTQAAGLTGAGIYNDLGTGTSYGSGLLTKNLNMTGQNSLSMFFNQDGVAALNGALDPFATSLFAVGGAFLDLPAFRTQANQYVFQGTWKGDVPTLLVTYQVDAPAGVPEPGTLALAGFALLVAGSVRLRKRYSNS